MAGEKKVVDASVVAKVFLQEPDAGKAEDLIRDHLKGKIVVLVPELIFLEVLNALKYKLKPSAEDLMDVAKALVSFQFHVERSSEILLKKTAEVSSRYNITIYDAAYVAIGELRSLELLTADKKLSHVPCMKQF